MRRFFVIGIDSTTVDQATSIKKWIEDNGFAWWHWIDGMWLIVTTNPDVSVLTIRDQVNELTSNTHNLVLEVEPETWAGFGPNVKERNMFDWLTSYWKS